VRDEALSSQPAGQPSLAEPAALSNGITNRAPAPAQPTPALSRDRQEQPSGDCPGAWPRLGVVHNARKAQAQLDRSCELAAFLG
jgi:hypothetical protein